MRRGFTLLEVLAALLVTGIGLSLLVPAARRTADRMAVRGARERLAGLAVAARARAVAEGGAVLVLDEPSASAWIETADGVGDSTGLGVDGLLAVELVGSRSRAALTFDGLGVGRVASQTVLFRRGGAEARLVFSAYGAVRRP